MKYIILLYIMLCVFFLCGCNYGDDTLKVEHSETVDLIENSEGSKAKKILEKHHSDGWFYIPQVMVMPHKDEVWFSVRVYSRDTNLVFKINKLSTSLDEKGVISSERKPENTRKWYSVGNGWYYEVERVKLYKHSQLLLSGLGSTTIELDVTADLYGQTESKKKSFSLSFSKVRRSGL